MTTAFPASLDAYGDPAGGSVQGSTTPTHSGHHANHNDAIEAIEAKLGTGSSAATANTVLRGTGAGTTGYGQVVNADINSAAAIAVTKLAAGAANQVLGAPGGVNTWINAPMYPTAEASRLAGSVALGNGAWTTITFDTEVADQDSMVTISGSTDRVTFTTAGSYLIFGAVEIGSAGGGTVRGVKLIISAAANLNAQFLVPSPGGFTTIPTVWGVWPATAGQYVQLQAYVDAAGVSTVNNNQATRLRVFRVGP